MSDVPAPPVLLDLDPELLLHAMRLLRPRDFGIERRFELRHATLSQLSPVGLAVEAIGYRAPLVT